MTSEVLVHTRWIDLVRQHGKHNVEVYHETTFKSNVFIPKHFVPDLSPFKAQWQTYGALVGRISWAVAWIVGLPGAGLERIAVIP